MRPLQAIGMGLVLVVLNAPAGGSGVDLFPDPVGWLLVLVGVRRLPDAVTLRPVLVGTGVLAAVVSAALWLPATASVLDGTDPSLQWSLELPRVGFLIALSWALSRTAGDARAQGWWRLVLVAAVVTALLPAVVYGAGVASLAEVAGGVAVATLLTCVVLCFSHSGRPWAYDAPASTGVSGD